MSLKDHSDGIKLLDQRDCVLNTCRSTVVVSSHTGELEMIFSTIRSSTDQNAKEVSCLLRELGILSSCAFGV